MLESNTTVDVVLIYLILYGQTCVLQVLTEQFWGSSQGRYILLIAVVFKFGRLKEPKVPYML